MKRFLCLMLSITIVFVLFFSIPISAVALKIDSPTVGLEQSGTTGDCNWVIENDTVIISGNGNMENYNLTKSPWQSCGGIKKVVFEEGVTSVGWAAFYNCIDLEEIVFSSTLEYISGAAFRDCYGLKRLTIPETVKTIGGYAFENCTGLTNLYVLGAPDTIIGGCAFQSCSHLSYVEISSNVSSIGSRAFYGCPQLSTVAVSNPQAEIGDLAFASGSSISMYGYPESTTESVVEILKTRSNSVFIPIKNVLLGDINDDGIVNGADAGLLARYTAGWQGYKDKIKNTDSADINRDGTINGGDAGILNRYTAGWENYKKYVFVIKNYQLKDNTFETP